MPITLDPYKELRSLPGSEELIDELIKNAKRNKIYTEKERKRLADEKFDKQVKKDPSPGSYKSAFDQWQRDMARPLDKKPDAGKGFAKLGENAVKWVGENAVPIAGAAATAYFVDKAVGDYRMQKRLKEEELHRRADNERVQRRNAPKPFLPGNALLTEGLERADARQKLTDDEKYELWLKELDRWMAKPQEE